LRRVLLEDLSLMCGGGGLPVMPFLRSFFFVCVCGEEETQSYSKRKNLCGVEFMYVSNGLFGHWLELTQ
jgi:hypothetical protein